MWQTNEMYLTILLNWIYKVNTTWNTSWENSAKMCLMQKQSQLTDVI